MYLHTLLSCTNPQVRQYSKKELDIIKTNKMFYIRKHTATINLSPMLQNIEINVVEPRFLRCRAVIGLSPVGKLEGIRFENVFRQRRKQEEYAYPSSCPLCI